MIPSDVLIDEPYQGTWVADITTTETPDGSFELGERTWHGALTPIGAQADGAQWHARIVGGKGKLGSVLKFKPYNASVSVAQIARDIIADCGETAGPIVATSRMPSYDRQRMSAGQALTQLCELTGLVWWVSRDGNVCIDSKRPAFAIDDTKAPQLTSSAQSSKRSVTTADDVQPGGTIGGLTVRQIQWTMKSALHAVCSFYQMMVPDEKAHGRYARVYKGKVSKQNANHSVDLIVDGEFTLPNVPVVPCVPGGVPKLLPGDLVEVGFFGWNPSTPYAVPAQLGGDSARTVALLQDTVPIFLPPMAFTGTIGGAPAAGVLTPLIAQTMGSIQGPGSKRLKLE